MVNEHDITATEPCLLICPSQKNDSKIITRVLNCTISARICFSRFTFGGGGGGGGERDEGWEWLKKIITSY